MAARKDPILTPRRATGGIVHQPLHQPESLESSRRMVLAGTKHDKTFDWVGPQSGLRDIVRQMTKYGWTVDVREESPVPA
jgi:hypothetical protein